MANAHIASVRSGIPKDIRRIFPDCVTKKWDPLPQKLNGRAAEAFKLAKEWADAAESGDTYSFRHLMKEMGVDRRNFKKNIREHEGFKSAIASIGGFEWAANKHYTAFCKN